MGLLSDIGNRYKEEKSTLDNKTQEHSNQNTSNSELLKGNLIIITKFKFIIIII